MSEEKDDFINVIKVSSKIAVMSTKNPVNTDEKKSFIDALFSGFNDFSFVKLTFQF